MKSKDTTLTEKIDETLDSWHLFEPDEYAAKSNFKQSILSLLGETLDNYTNWLYKCGYTDSDTWAEEPTAVKRYLKENKLK